MGAPGAGAEDQASRRARGPGGVVVIDAKNWSGTVTVRDGVLRQNGYQRGRQTDGVAQAAAAVTAILAPAHRTSTRAVLCLASQDQEVRPVTGVDIVGRWQLPELLLTMPPRLDAYAVADIARHLHQELDGPAQAAGARHPRRSRPATGPRPARSTAPRRAGLLRQLGRLVVTLAAIWLACLFVIHVALSAVPTVGR